MFETNLSHQDSSEYLRCVKQNFFFYCNSYLYSDYLAFVVHMFALDIN